MIRNIALAAAVLALTGCATHSEPKPAVCDGKHRRPANLYGSVLPSMPGDAHAAPAPTAPGAPPANKTPGPLSSADPSSFAPCGGAA